MSKYIHAVHDVDGAELMADKPGWLVVTVAIGHDPHDFSGVNFYAWTSRGYSVIVRLNNGYAPAGTIPTPDRYQDFAVRCANFVGASPGASFVIIGNEPNHENERPNGQIIYPENYADCYRRCYQQIKARSAAVKVLVAGCAPWDNSAGMDWLDYWRTVLVHCGVCDGFALHTYTHGPDPSLITSEEKQHGWHWQFRVYQEQCNAIADTDLDYLPVFLTETDQTEPWLDQDNGWVQAAYGEIDAWNQAGRTPKIHCLALFRSNQDDQWSFAAKNGVKQAFQAVVAKGYTVATAAGPTPIPTPPQPQPPQPTPEPPREIDPDLIERGVIFTAVELPAGTGYWRITYAAWLEDAANQVGPDHHILGQVLRDGVETAGVSLRVEWPSGDTTITSKADDPNATYNYDYAMSPSLNEYSIVVDDGSPSDIADNIGMGKDGNPKEHTSTWITFEWTISEGEVIPEPIPPEPEPAPQGKLIWPVSGPITQPFGVNPAYYAQYGQAGHNGIDIGCPEGTPVQAIADGEVMYSGWDDGYGNYIRIFYAAINSHSVFAHLSSVSGAVGANVKQGEIVAASGNTGNSTGDHLHYELRAGSRDAYYEGVTYGYTHGRYNPVEAYVVTGSALSPGVGL